MKNNTLNLSFENLSYAPTRAEHYEKYSILQLNGAIEFGSSAGPLVIYSTAPSTATDLFRIATGVVAAKEGNVKITMNDSTVTNGGIYIPAEPTSIPWLSVSENIKLAVKISGKQSDSDDIKRALELAGLDSYEQHIPHGKSYGFRLRIVLARALAMNPHFLAIGEILPKMDEVLRGEILKVLQRISVKAGIPVLVAARTHEQVNIPHTGYLMERNETTLVSVLENRT